MINSDSFYHNSAFPDYSNTNSPSEIRNTLIQKGVLPSPDEANKTFWSLGNNWWKQIIDGRFHQYGKKVFDEGLHGKHTEPGYFKEISTIRESTVNNLNEHFEAIKKRLLLSNSFVGCGDVRNISIFHSAEKITYTLKMFLTKRCSLEQFLSSEKKLKDFQIEINYYETENSEIVTNKLFAEYNTNILNIQKIAFERIQTNQLDIESIKIQYQESVLPLIAQFYGELEWTHPWIDGQGRTDLILLSGLLSREGLHPCILRQPYFSSGHKLEEWISYLNQGLKQFEVEKGKV